MRARTRQKILDFLWGLIILALIASAILAVAYYMNSRRLALLRQSPMTLPVDLGTPGKYTASYRQLARPSKPWMHLDLTVGSGSAPVTEADLEELRFSIAVSDASGRTVRDGALAPDSPARKGSVIVNPYIGRGFTIVGMSLPEGDYAFELTVTQPATALAGRAQALRARYSVGHLPLTVESEGLLAAFAAFAALALMALRLVIGRLRVAAVGRCSGCGYDLTGNTSGRCPECGAASTGHG